MSKGKRKCGKSEHTLNIAIGAYPSPAISLEQEMTLLKSAIIYGDSIKLYSLTASVLLLQRRTVNFSFIEKIKLFEQVAPFLDVTDTQETLGNLRMFKELLYKKNKTKEAIKLIQKSEQMMNSQWSNITDVIFKLWDQSGFSEVAKLVDSGIVAVHQFKGMKSSNGAIDYMAECIEAAARSQQGTLNQVNNGTTDKVVDEFVNSLASSITESGTYPLFDSKTSDLIRSGVEANVIQVSDKAYAKGKNVALAAHLLNKLPSFEDLTLDEVIDIRRELATPLIRFRSAMMKYSDKIKTAHWDSDFAIDAENVFHTDVAPAVLDIEESLKSNRLISQIFRSVSDKPLTVATSSGIGLVLSNFTELPDTIAKGLGAGAAVAPIIYDAYNRWKEKNANAKSNLLYFYYGVKKRAGDL